MKFLQISTLLILLSGCTTTNKEWDYLGTAPSYAVVPHAPACPCCFFKISVDNSPDACQDIDLTIKK